MTRVLGGVYGYFYSNFLSNGSPKPMYRKKDQQYTAIGTFRVIPAKHHAIQAFLIAARLILTVYS